MKLFLKLFITLTLFFDLLNVQAQPQSITLTFTSRTDTYGEYTSLDSILIINRNRNCDTVLYAPDTSFVLYYTVGVQNRIPKDKFPFISALYPNPSKNGNVKFSIHKKRAGMIHVQISDLQGNIFKRETFTIKKGVSFFDLKLSKTGLFLLSVNDENNFATKKILINRSSVVSDEIVLLSSNSKYKNTKTTNGNPWWFEPGDTLWYVGYAKTPQEINGSDIMEDAPTGDTLITLRILEGIPCAGTVAVKYGGHLYPTVQIKDRCWLKESLDIGVMINGDSTMKDNGIIEKYCYDNDPANCETYGGLYQWDELMQYTTEEKAQGICPDGWYVPTIDEWNNMTQGYTGNDFKERGNAHWHPGSMGENTTGFTALPAGGRNYNAGIFRLIGEDVPFYTSTKLDPPLWGVYYKEFGMTSVMVWGNMYGTEGLSLRCIKDQ